MQIIAHTDRVEGSNLDRCNDKDSDWVNCSIHFEDARPRCPSLPISIAQIGLTVPLDAAAMSLAIAHNASERLRRGSSFLENFSLSRRESSIGSAAAGEQFGSEQFALSLFQLQLQPLC